MNFKNKVELKKQSFNGAAEIMKQGLINAYSEGINDMGQELITRLKKELKEHPEWEGGLTRAIVVLYEYGC